MLFSLLNESMTKVLKSDELKKKTQTKNFINEETLEKTLESIARIDKEKRKIIVYVGVHPNEGTAELTRKYADGWNEKYGVLVICHPTSETPHGIWEAHRAKSTADEIPPLPKSIELSEDDYENKFSLGEETFFIRFHGTPLSKPEGKRKLEVITSMYEDAQDMYIEGTFSLRYGNPEIVKGLEKILPDVDQAGYPGNVITVEYYYVGTPVESDDPYIKKLLELNNKRSENGVPLIFEEDQKWWRKGNIRPYHIVQPRLSEEDIRDFHNNFIQQFEKLLQHLSQKIK